jgi:hypothetical protein
MGNTINFSEIESKRFNLNIARSKMIDIQIKEISNFVNKNYIDIVILRIPTEKIEQASKLMQLGYPYYQTDTLVYYKVDFTVYHAKELKNNDLQFVLATINDVEHISKLIDVIFPGYTNHYNSNPLINIENVIEGYKEWVINYIDRKDKFVFLVRKNGKYIGFASCSINDGIAEGILYGVLPEVSGGGIYSDIIRYTQMFFIQKGAGSMKVSTQVQNYAVQKVWSREGFFLFESFATIHINAMLNYSIVEKKQFDIFFSTSDINLAGELSGDWNPVHFNDVLAKKMGFDKRITHGLLSNAALSKYFGTVFPGNGTLFMGYTYKFIKPIYPEEKYTVNVTVPMMDKNREYYLCVIKVFDKQNNLCLISYNQLIKR